MEFLPATWTLEILKTPPPTLIIHRSVYRKCHVQISCKERKGISPGAKIQEGLQNQSAKTQKLKTWCPRGYQISIQAPQLRAEGRTPRWGLESQTETQHNREAHKGCPLHQNGTRKFCIRKPQKLLSSDKALGRVKSFPTLQEIKTPTCMGGFQICTVDMV